jgi:hypothetical protein
MDVLQKPLTLRKRIPMNTKFFFASLIIVIAFIATACAPALIDSSAPVVQAVQLANNEISAIMPVTGESASTAARDAQEPQLWSGEIVLSDNNSPDYLRNSQPAASEASQDGCISEDSRPERQSGCVE